MALQLTQRGASKNWYIRGSVRGMSVFVSTKTDDRDAADSIRILLEGQMLQESIFGKRPIITFAEAARSHVESGGSARFLEVLHQRIGDRKLHTLTQSDLDAAAKALYPDCLPATLNRQCYAPFIAVWNHAVRQRWADVRVWQRPKKPKGTNIVAIKERRSGSAPTSYERAATFVAAMSPGPAMLMTGLFYTGMRPIELLTLNADDVDIDKRWIVLWSTKTGEPRGVPIHDFLVPLFASLIKRGGNVFRTPRGEPYPMLVDGGGHIKTAINGARLRLAREAFPNADPKKLKPKDSPISDVSPYTARHTVSTQLVVNGVHPYVKDQILGHAVTDMSRRYTNIPQAPLIEAINTLPVPDAWCALKWWEDPLAWAGRLAAGTGARNDLKEKR